MNTEMRKAINGYMDICEELSADNALLREELAQSQADSRIKIGNLETALGKALEGQA